MHHLPRGLSTSFLLTSPMYDYSRQSTRLDWRFFYTSLAGQFRPKFPETIESPLTTALIAGYGDRIGRIFTEMFPFL